VTLATARLVYAATVTICVILMVLVAIGEARIDEAIAIPICIVIGAIGLLAVRQERNNAIGWLFIGLAFFLIVDSTFVAYVQAPEEFRADLPNRIAAWFGTWVSLVWIGIAMGLIPVLFPTGKLLSPRWGIVVWAAIAGVGLNILTTMVHGGPMELGDTDTSAPAVQQMVNPFGLESLNSITEPLGDAGNALSIVAAIFGGISIVVRLRRSQGQERQQLKLFTFTAAVGVFGLATAIAGSTVADGSTVFTVIAITGWFTFMIALLIGMPITVALAILRHGLYNVDRIISKTLVYASLTALLGASYFGIVVALQAILPELSGGNDLAIALTTLVVAALFLPARRQAQTLVDRRFNRRAHDAALTVDAFSARLRDHIDLDTLRYELLAVVDATLQPNRSLTLGTRRKQIHASRFFRVPESRNDFRTP
jgi:hypothetical protein